LTLILKEEYRPNVFEKIYLRTIIGSKGTREERTGRNRIMRAFFIFKLTKCYTDDKIKKEKKSSLNIYGKEEKSIHVIDEKSEVKTIKQSFMLDIHL
jgi:hypothetical protein